MLLAFGFRTLGALSSRAVVCPTTVLGSRRLSQEAASEQQEAAKSLGPIPDGYVSDEDYADNTLQDLAGDLKQIRRSLRPDVYRIYEKKFGSPLPEHALTEADAFIETMVNPTSVCGNYILQWQRLIRDGLYPPGYVREISPDMSDEPLLADAVEARMVQADELPDLELSDDDEKEAADDDFYTKQAIAEAMDLPEQQKDGANKPSKEEEQDAEELLQDYRRLDQERRDASLQRLDAETIRTFNRSFLIGKQAARRAESEPATFVEYTPAALDEDRKVALSPRLQFDLATSPLVSADERDKLVADGAEKLKVFLEAIGRNQIQHLKKFQSFNDLLHCTGNDLKKRGIPVTDRRFIFRWREKYLRGWFFPGDPKRSHFYPQEKRVRKPKLMKHRKKKMLKAAKQAMVK